MTVIDVHTHMFTTKWLELLKNEGGIYNIKTRPDGQREIFRGDTPVVLPQKGHFDWELRIQHMDQAKIDVSVVSLTCPNVYWGGEEVSVRAAREANDNVADAQSATPTASAGSPRCPGSTRSARWKNWSAAAPRARSA
jgi:aminocarboxymuconate-semialdehyde decarboxylase